MQRIFSILASVALLISTCPAAAEEALRPSNVTAADHPALQPVRVEGGSIVIHVPVDGGSGEAVVDIVVPNPPVPAGPASYGPESDILIDPALVRMKGALKQIPTIVGPNYPVRGNVTPNRPPDLNGLNAFFSSATGGFGFRIGYDRRLSPVLRLTAGPEFLTYGFEKSVAKLGGAMPLDVTRISLMSIPVGLQRQFNTQARLVPHVGFGAGPIVRFDHRSGPPGFYDYGYGPGGIGISTAADLYGGAGIGVGLPIEDFPRLSLTLGGFASTGANIRFGKKKDIAISVEGRYTLAHFIDVLGNPGDFSGFSVAVGFGKYF